METIEIIIAINDNSPWAKYAAKAIFAQRLETAQIVKISIVTRNQNDPSVLDFLSSLSEGLKEITEIYLSPLGSQGAQIAEKAKLSSANYVVFCAGYVYWIDPFKLQSQLSIMQEHRNVYTWHPLLVRSQEKQALFPQTNSYKSNAKLNNVNPSDVPWQSLLVPTLFLKDFNPENEAINLVKLRNYLARNFDSQSINQPCAILQNSAGRGPLALNLRDFALTQLSNSTISKVNWTTQLENGTLSNSHIDDLILNYKLTLKMSNKDKVRKTTIEAKRKVLASWKRFRRNNGN